MHVNECRLFFSSKCMYVGLNFDCDYLLIEFLSFSYIAEVAEELCKTASSGHCGPLHPFSHDMPLLPSKSRTLHKHTENKENIEGGLDGRSDHGTHGHSGTARHAHLTTNQSDAPHYAPAGTPEDTDSQSTLQRRRARRLKRRAVIFLPDWPLVPASGRSSSAVSRQTLYTGLELQLFQHSDVFDF